MMGSPREPILLTFLVTIIRFIQKNYTTVERKKTENTNKRLRQKNSQGEMYMKKKLAILLMMLMISVSLAGCVSNDTDPVVETKEITDSDSDGVPDTIDNCPDLFNPDQFSGLTDYECDEDEVRSQLNQPVIMPRSGGGNQVTDLQITPSSNNYNLQDTIEASFTGTWFWWLNQYNTYRPPNVDVAIDLEDSQGNVVYQNVIAYSGMSVSLDSHSPNDAAIGMRIWEETGPSHPIFGGPNGLDFSASTLGLGIFCWVGSLTAHIDVAGQYHSSGSHYTQFEHASANECFEITNNYSYFNPTGNKTTHTTTYCEPGYFDLHRDVHETNSSNSSLMARPKATLNNFHSDPWYQTIPASESNSPWHNSFSPPWLYVSPSTSEWVWLNQSDFTDWTAWNPPPGAPNIDVKMSFDVPQGATDVVAKFNGYVDNAFISPNHPDTDVMSQPPVVIIQDSSSKVLTSWMMDKVYHSVYSDAWNDGQEHRQALPDSLGSTDSNFELILSAEDWSHYWGVSFQLEVTYCLPIPIEYVDTPVGQDNHPPHIDAEVYFTDPGMLNYVYNDGDTADQYNYSAFISWDTWDVDGVVETVEVDYDRDGVADVMLPENESPYYHLIYPYHHGVEFERAILDGVCYILSFRMIDLIATDDDGDSVTYTIRTGTDEVNDWDYPENGVPVTFRRDAQWLMDLYLIQDTEYLDWIYGVGTNECPSPIEYEFEENPDPLSDGGLIGTLNIISMGDESYSSNHMIGATITGSDPATGNPVTNSCGVSFIYTGSGPNLAAGEYWEIYEIDSGDGLVCGINPADVSSYTWELNLYGSQFNLPNSYITIT